VRLGIEQRSNVTSAAYSGAALASSAPASAVGAAVDFRFIVVSLFQIRFCLVTPSQLVVPAKRGPMVPRTTASRMLDPRLRGDDGTASYKPNTNSMVAFLARFFNSGELAIRPIWLRVRPVAMAMYCLPSTA
jgi:hypothetical protein